MEICIFGKNQKTNIFKTVSQFTQQLEDIYFNICPTEKFKNLTVSWDISM